MHFEVSKIALTGARGMILYRYLEAGALLKWAMIVLFSVV